MKIAMTFIAAFAAYFLVSTISVVYQRMIFASLTTELRWIKRRLSLVLMYCSIPMIMICLNYYVCVVLLGGYLSYTTGQTVDVISLAIFAAFASVMYLDVYPSIAEAHSAIEIFADKKKILQILFSSAFAALGVWGGVGENIVQTILMSSISFGLVLGILFDPRFREIYLED